MTSDIQRLHTNARMSKIVQHGGQIFLCGQTSSGSAITDVEGQTREVLARIDALLTEAGSDRSRLLSAVHPPPGHQRLCSHEQRVGRLGATRRRPRTHHGPGPLGQPQPTGRDHGDCRRVSKACAGRV